jgi:hypothetical protein
MFSLWPPHTSPVGRQLYQDAETLILMRRCCQRSPGAARTIASGIPSTGVKKMPRSAGFSRVCACAVWRCAPFDRCAPPVTAYVRAGLSRCCVRPRRVPFSQTNRVHAGSTSPIHRQLPHAGTHVVAHEVGVARDVSQFEVAVIRSEPLIEHVSDIDASLAQHDRAGCLLTATTRVAFDMDRENRIQYSSTRTGN